MLADYDSIREMFLKKHDTIPNRADVFVLKVMSDPEKGSCFDHFSPIVRFMFYGANVLKEF